MLAPRTALPAAEHLTPHDLVTYFRCPYEMELVRANHARTVTGGPGTVRTPADVVPLRHSPMFSPPLGHVVVTEGRLDLDDRDILVYEDEGEDDLPMLFPPERVRLDPRFQNAGRTLVDRELELAGRPDLIVQRADGSLVPVEYKETHLFVGYHEAHGRVFDTVQSIVECRLVEANFGRKVPYGIVLYGDEKGGGLHEGWVRIPYGDAELGWLKAVLSQVRQDDVRAPVPAERNCGGCEPNAEGQCRFAAARYEGPHHRAAMWQSPRSLTWSGA
ncbi:MAG TPA: hypothetical protein VMF04_05905 [Thermoplasmata archaeon]|nr:hypothetical protein [Thermoplasmata archaeon]